MELSQGRETETEKKKWQWRSALDSAFASASADFREAHRTAAGILQTMAKDDSVLHEVLTTALLEPEFLRGVRINPVIALPMAKTEAYTLVANCWIPRPDGDSSLTHQSIHHHGNLLLTSVGAYGSGYETILFQKNCAGDVDSARDGGGDHADLKVDKIYQNQRGHVEFVDSFAPHVVFYPKELSVTYALWSKERPALGSRMASSTLLQRYKAPVKKALQYFGLSSLFKLNQSNDLDFYVHEGRFVRLKDRIQYKAGTNANFLQALHFLARETGLQNPEALARLVHAQGDPRWLNEFEPEHLFLPKVNLSRREIFACLN